MYIACLVSCLFLNPVPDPTGGAREGSEGEAEKIRRLAEGKEGEKGGEAKMMMLSLLEWKLHLETVTERKTQAYRKRECCMWLVKKWKSILEKYASWTP